VADRMARVVFRVLARTILLPSERRKAEPAFSAFLDRWGDV
jgi:hypothetical protein